MEPAGKNSRNAFRKGVRTSKIHEDPTFQIGRAHV